MRIIVTLDNGFGLTVLGDDVDIMLEKVREEMLKRLTNPGKEKR